MNGPISKYRKINYWSRQEKSALLSALYKYGANDVEVLKKVVATKSEFEIQKRINQYKRLSSNIKRKKNGYVDVSDDMSTRKKSRYVVWPDDVKLNQWTCAISNSSENRCSKTLLPEALRIIAHLESRPSAESEKSVDLKSLYLYLADVIEGKILATINPSSREFLINVLMKLNMNVKKEQNISEINFLENITRVFPDIMKPVFSENTPRSQALNELLSSIIYNPLEIPENFLENHLNSES